MEATLEDVIKTLDEYKTKHGYLPIEILVRGALDHGLREYKSRQSARDKQGDYFMLLGVKVRQERGSVIEVVK